MTGRLPRMIQKGSYEGQKSRPCVRGYKKGGGERKMVVQRWLSPWAAVFDSIAISGPL